MTYRLVKTGDGSNTLYATEFEQTFHSIHGALTESKYVFLSGTAIDHRLAQGLPARVLEIGFGTGLNFLVTAQAGRAGRASLHYVALDKALLPTDVLARLNHEQQLGAARDLRRTFLKWRSTLSDPIPETHLRRTVETAIILELILGDATSVPIPALDYHAIYLDAFSPDANPELWTQAFLARLYEVLKPGGTLATYSVKGTVRRNLQAVGFQVEKRPGPPGKREMLVARR